VLGLLTIPDYIGGVELSDLDPEIPDEEVEETEDGVVTELDEKLGRPRCRRALCPDR
jgi:hypothetical protein